MKKIVAILMIFGFMSTVLAHNGIKEVDLNYVIPNDYDEDTFVVKTDNFDVLGDKIKLNIHLKNNSGDQFEYRDYSFKLVPTSNNDYSKVSFSFDSEYNDKSIDSALTYINNSELGNPYFKEYFKTIDNEADLNGIVIDKRISNYDLYLEFILDRITYEKN